MKLLATGGAGFIGSHLSEELVRRGYATVIIDDLSTGKMENIQELLRNENVEFVRGSVTDLALIERLLKETYCVFHLAAVSSVPRSIESPQASHEVNVGGTLNVLLAARENGVKKVIYSSSSAVYGDAPSLSKKEDMTPQPLSPYAVTKLAGEYYCRVFQDIYQLPTVCLRYFNVYGPKQDPDSQYAAVIPIFIKMVSGGNAPVIFGDGEQTRDFTFVKDVVVSNILAAESGACGILNIGSGESTTTNHLAGLTIELLGSNVMPVHRETRAGDIRYSQADISRARAIGYEPRYSLKAGLGETIKWLRGR